MKYYLLTLIPLILTIPLWGEGLLFGVPIWALSSLLFALVYAIVLNILIDKKWDNLS